MNNGIHKTAMFLSGLPEPAANALLQRLEPGEAKQIRVEMLKLANTPPERIRKTVAEFIDAIETSPVANDAAQKPEIVSPTYERPTASKKENTAFDCETTQSGTFHPVPMNMDSFVQGVDTLSTNRIADTSSQQPLPQPQQESKFAFLQHAEPDKLSELLTVETPQVIAVVLSQLPSILAGKVLSRFTVPTQKLIVAKLIRLEEPDDAVLEEIESVLRERYERNFGPPRRNIGRDTALKILKTIAPAMRREILGDMNIETFDTAVVSTKPVCPQEETSFEDLKLMPQNQLSQLFDSVDTATALVSLIGASRELIDKVVGDYTPERQSVLQRKLKDFGPVSSADIQNARKRILHQTLVSPDSSPVY